MFKRSQLLIVIAVSALIIIILSVFLFSGKEDSAEKTPSTIPSLSSRPSSSFKPLDIKPILTKEVPLKPVDQGGGVNLDSSLVKQSQAEVAKIMPFLPYEDIFTAPSGKTISILIPGAQFQTTPWLIDAQIFNVDYQVSESDTDYSTQKDLFRSAAQNIFDWMKSKGVDPKKMIINWGDKAYIRERAEKWLNQ